MIGTALLFDGIQAFLTFILIGVFVNWIITIWAYLTFFLWFSFLGIHFMKPANFTSLNGGLIVELIPLLNALPTWTLAVTIIIAKATAEDVLAQFSPEMAQAVGKML